MWKGLLHVASPAVMVTLHGVSAVQTALGVEKPGRKLTAAEVGQLKRVFGDSVDYGKIRVKEGSSGLLTAFSDRPWCMGNTIYLPKPSKDPAKRMSTLVHETVHVWQHQHAGTTYLSSSIYGQTAGDGYDYNKGIREGKRFDQLSAEHQAKFIQRAYEEGAFGSDGSVGGFYEGGIDYTAYLRDAIKQVRSGNGAA
jgi:hypothetical protein